MNLEIHRSVNKQWTVLTLLGELDMGGAPTLRQSVVNEVISGNRHIVLDFSGVYFIDSSGLGAIIGALRRVRSHEGELLIICLEPDLRKVFELCELDQIFKMDLDYEAIKN